MSIQDYVTSAQFEYEMRLIDEIAQQPFEQRLHQYLRNCVRRGSHYQPGRDTYPTCKRLSQYLQCDPSTVYRLATGETTRPDMATLNMLRIFACILPPAPIDQMYEERSSRLRDADWYLKNRQVESKTPVDLTRYLLRRIAHRVNKRAD